jgi:hypothetical protein
MCALSWAAFASAAPGHGRQALPQPEVALERALAIFRPDLADPSYRLHGKVDPRGATVVLRDLAATYRQLSPSDRGLAEAILDRPTDSGTDPNTGLPGYTAPKSDFRHKCFTHFCIHWVRSTRDAPSLRDRSPKNHIPDWIDKVKSVMNVVWTKEVETFNYGAPKGDGNSGSHHGGNPNSRIDIFIQDVGRFGLYGLCSTDDPRIQVQNDVSAYCIFDDGFSKKQFPGIHGVNALKVTAAHEFNHAIQFNYDAFEDIWFLEATATNMEADVYPTIHDNYQYFPASPLSKTRPSKPIDRWEQSGLNQYGSWIFFRFLAEYFTSPTHPMPSNTAPNAAFVREIWQDAKAVPGTINGGLYSTQAIEDFLADHGENFTSIFRQFGVANAAPAAWYRDGALFKTRAGQSYPLNTVNGGTTGSADLPMTHMSNDYWFFKPGATATTLDIAADFPSGVPGEGATVLLFDTNGALVDAQEISLDGFGDGGVNGVTFDDSSASKVIVVVTNASTQFTQCYSDQTSASFFSCYGKPVDDFKATAFKLDISAP